MPTSSLPRTSLSHVAVTMKFLTRLFSRKARSGRMSEKSAVLFPLYIYPDEGAWDPLYEAVKAHPNLNFIVIINPHNGPGVTPPDTEYSREIPKLNAFANVSVAGYVRLDYCKRDIRDVCADVRTYAEWEDKFCVKGIFFDECPNLNDDGKTGEYLKEIAGYVKGMEGILGDRLVINNPGTVPAISLTSPDIDIWVICEDSFERWQSDEVREWMATNKYTWENCCYMVHSAPEGDISRLAKELKTKGKFVFITDLTSRFYEGFGKDWAGFVRRIDG